MVGQKEGLAHFFEDGHDRVFAAEDHAMVEIVVDPGADRLFDVAEVEHHAAIIELGAFDRNDRPAIVAMQVAALAFVVQ